MNTSYLDDILEQPDALRRSIAGYPLNDPDLVRLAQKVQSGGYHQIILTGMGSSFYNCYPLWLSLTQRAIPANMIETSELIHYVPEAITERTLLIAVSQSGESIEIKNLTQIRRRPGLCVSVTNGLENTLARWSDLTLDTWAGNEATVSSKTYVTALAVLHLLSCQLIEQELEVAQEALRQVSYALGDFLTDWQSKKEFVADFLGPSETLVFIGRGPSMASALTGALITQESSKVFCSAASAAQFRHGPLEVARPGFQAVVFAGNHATTAFNERLAREISTYGGQVLFITPNPDADQMPSGIAQLSIPQAPPAILPILEIAPVELLTIALAEARGYEPGVFEHCGKITTVE
jgi:glucosamine--fructose-6-phosphate aminotransferase (isomerizing)